MLGGIHDGKFLPCVAVRWNVCHPMPGLASSSSVSAGVMVIICCAPAEEQTLAVSNAGAEHCQNLADSMYFPPKTASGRDQMDKRLVYPTGRTPCGRVRKCREQGHDGACPSRSIENMRAKRAQLRP